MTSTKHFHLIVPVWGSEYTKLFVDICLPMLITPGNLQSFSKQPDNKFVIITTWADYLVIKESASYEHLKSIMMVEFILIDGVIDFSTIHQAMSECYSLAINREGVIPGETYFIFLTPDSFWPEGTFRHLIELADQDIKVAMAGGLRVNKEPVSDALNDWIAQNTDNPAMPLVDLIKLSLNNLHRLSTALNILSEEGFLNQWPSHIYWINKKEYQMIAHCFHLHPLMVLASESKMNIKTTIDGDFLESIKYPLESYHVIDTDFIAIELTSTDKNWGQTLSAPSLSKIIRFSLFHTNSLHWYFFSKRIVINGSPELPIDSMIEKLADDLLAEVLTHRRFAKYFKILKCNYILTKIEPIKQVSKNIMSRLKMKIKSL